MRRTKRDVPPCKATAATDFGTDAICNKANGHTITGPNHADSRLGVEWADGETPRVMYGR